MMVTRENGDAKPVVNWNRAVAGRHVDAAASACHAIRAAENDAVEQGIYLLTQ